jgi:cell division protein FtsN
MAGEQRSARRRGGRKSGPTIVVGIAIGVLLGLAAALGVALYINKGPSPFVERVPPRPRAAPEQKRPLAATPEPVTAVRPPQAAERERELPLDYHEMLEGTPDRRAPRPVPQAPRGTTVYYLQIAALSNAEDADNLKARLALQGIEARIQTVQRDDRMLHRVRVGPFPSVEEADKAQARLRQNQIDAARVQEIDRSPGP